MNPEAKSKSNVQSIVKKWVNRLNQPDDPRGISRGERAQLRRARSSEEVVTTVAFHRLLAELEPAVARSKDLQWEIAIARVLCRVKADSSAQPFAVQMAEKQGDRPRVSEIRFRRLLRIDDRETLGIELVRIVALLDAKVNVADLTESIYDWNAKKRKSWAIDYYQHLI